MPSPLNTVDSEAPVVKDLQDSEVSRTTLSLSAYDQEQRFSGSGSVDCIADDVSVRSPFDGSSFSSSVDPTGDRDVLRPGSPRELLDRCDGMPRHFVENVKIIIVN